jgi:hypothetical protein
MTVITFSKNFAVSSVFDKKFPYCRKENSSYFSNVYIKIAALFSVISILIMFLCGIVGIKLILDLREKSVLQKKLEKEIEDLNMEYLKVSNPNYIAKRAQMLQLIISGKTQFATLELPDELAKK